MRNLGLNYNASEMLTSAKALVERNKAGAKAKVKEPCGDPALSGLIGVPFGAELTVRSGMGYR